MSLLFDFFSYEMSNLTPERDRIEHEVNGETTMSYMWDDKEALVEVNPHSDNARYVAGDFDAEQQYAWLQEHRDKLENALLDFASFSELLHAESDSFNFPTGRDDLFERLIPSTQVLCLNGRNNQHLCLIERFRYRIYAGEVYVCEMKQNGFEIKLFDTFLTIFSKQGDELQEVYSINPRRYMGEETLKQQSARIGATYRGEQL